MYGYGNFLPKIKAGASVPAAPANIVQPSLVGNGAVGSVVTCNPGAWSGSPSPTFSYDFRVNGISVQSGASNTYTPLIGDDTKTLTCLVTATNSQGSASEGTSNSLVIGRSPVNTVAPTLSPSGTQYNGAVITLGNGTFTGTATLTYAYRWKRNGIVIVGQTANTYTIVSGDDGTIITGEVKATNSYGETAFISTSNQVNAVNATAPVNTIAPVISGTATLGSTLTSTTGTWTGLPTPSYTYQWYRGESIISGATNSTYVTVVADSIASITCVVTATNLAGSSNATSNALTMNNYTPVNTVAPVISGTAVVGQTLSTTNGTWSNSPASFSYQWKRGATNIGTNSSTYTLVQADAGNTSNITCVVTATNTAGSANASSNQIAQILTIRTNSFLTASAISDATIRGGLNTFDIGLISNSLDTKMKAVYPFVGGTASTHRWNFMNAADTNAAFRLVFSGTITHNSNGITGNGSNGFANTFLVPSAALTNNSLNVSFYSRTSAAAGSTEIGCSTSGFLPIIGLSARTAINTINFDGYDFSDHRISASNSDGAGFYHGNILTSTNQRIYKNGVSQVFNSISQTQSQPTVQPIYILARNDAGTAANLSARNLAFSAIGDGLTDTEATNYYNLVQALQTTLGRQII